MDALRLDRYRPLSLISLLVLLLLSLISGAHRASVHSSLDSEEKQVQSSLGSEEKQVQSYLGSEEKQVQSSLGSEEKQVQSSLGSEEKQMQSSLGSEEKQVQSSLGSEEKQVQSSLGFEEKQVQSSLGSEEKQVQSSLGSEEKQMQSSLGSEEKKVQASLDSEEKQVQSSLGSEEKQMQSSLGSKKKRVQPSLGSKKKQVQPSSSEEREQSSQSSVAKDESFQSSAEKEQSSLDIEEKEQGSEEKKYDSLVSMIESTTVSRAIVKIGSSTMPQTTMKIVGSSTVPAKVYIKLNHNTPHVLCLTQHLRDAELTDPKYQWHGPDGKALPDSSNVIITPTGTLIIRHFKEDMSGMYTCSLHFATPMKQYEKKYFLKYVFYAYIDPNFFYEFSVRYHSAPCQSIYNISFERMLHKLLKKLVKQLFCEVLLLKADCHQVKMQRAGLHNEIFFHFSVFALDTPEEMVCSNDCASMERLTKAKQLIETFFEKQGEKLQQLNKTLPEIYYIQGTFHIVWVNRCFPGYGMDSKLHSACPNCCVICGPGTYNPQDGVHCLPCDNSVTYGARTC